MSFLHGAVMTLKSMATRRSEVTMISEFILKNTVISGVATAIMISTIASNRYQYYITFFLIP